MIDPATASQWAVALKDGSPAALTSELTDSLVTLDDAAAVMQLFLALLPTSSPEQQVHTAMRTLEELAITCCMHALLLMEALRPRASDLFLSDVYDSIGLWQWESGHQFRMFLHDVPSHSERSAQDGIFDEEEGETAGTLLMRVCAELQETTEARCEIEGFGLRWFADVAHDFCMVLEDLPEVLTALRAGHDAMVGFYEQGLQRLVHLHPSRRLARCVDMNTQADLGQAWFDPDLLLEDLREMLRCFVSYVWQAFPATASHPLFMEWQQACLPEAAA